MLEEFDLYAASLPPLDPRPMTGEALVLRAILLLARVTQSPPWIGHLDTQLAPFAEPFPRRRFAAQGPLSDGEAVAGGVALALAGSSGGGEWHHIPDHLRKRALQEDAGHASAMTGPFLIECGLANSKPALIEAGVARLHHGTTGWSALALCDAFSLIDEAADQDHALSREFLAVLTKHAAPLELRMRDMLGGLLERQGPEGSWPGGSGIDLVTETALHLFVLREAERLDIGPEDGGREGSGTEILAAPIAAAEAFLTTALPPGTLASAAPATIGARMMGEALRIAARRDSAMHSYFDYV